MDKKIIWSPKSIVAFDGIIDYLQKQWSDKEVEKFISRTNEVLEKISSGTILFRSSKKRNIREVLITKQNLLLYRERKDYIELVLFWDTRRNPRKKFKRN